MLETLDRFCHVEVHIKRCTFVEKIIVRAFNLFISLLYICVSDTVRLPYGYLTVLKVGGIAVLCYHGIEIKRLVRLICAFAALM